VSLPKSLQQPRTGDDLVPKPFKGIVNVDTLTLHMRERAVGDARMAFARD
jgi:hypothetical protein